MSGDGRDGDAVRHVGSITLVRHGRTSYNAEGRMQGQIDIPLDRVGLWQIRQTGAALREEYVDGRERRQLVVASDLSRAYTTAKAFAQPLGLKIHADKRLRERSFGSWEGLTIAEVRERWPEDFRSWMLAGGGELRHGAEAKSAVGLRGLAALEEWAAAAGDETDLYIFSHGSWIAQTMQALMGISRIRPDHASFGSMRNAHWARFIPRPLTGNGLRWSMQEYNRGPLVAREADWDTPDEELLSD
ncbi:histidine phosphatase family protein [Bifidobacterium xylocopae]|uniref:Phosphoglycerate mutase n=1 Tax=Bifidobacterium xylocopae TaxID=2493119 RepID=A0A366KCR0_9BIFI|nr:histidine phosphatase family protein [Bifidobacterium xylocopae]RBP99510.1 phosphoglycerate mutase [Bifidobacterium xylocopae]